MGTTLVKATTMERDPRRALRDRLASIAHFTLWQYADDTPVERLHRHHRIARRVVYIWMASSVAMIASLVDFLASSGWWQQVALVILCVTGAISGLTMLPAILCGAWASEVESTLKARGSMVPLRQTMDKLVPRSALKMMYWATVLVLIVWLKSKR